MRYVGGTIGEFNPSSTVSGRSGVFDLQHLLAKNPKETTLWAMSTVYTTEFSRSTTDASTYTFGSVTNLNTADVVTRIMNFAIADAAASSGLSSVLVNGTSATLIHDPGVSRGAALYYHRALIATTTYAVALTYNGTATRAMQHTLGIVGMMEPTNFTVAATGQFAAGTSGVDINIDLAPGEALVGALGDNDVQGLGVSLTGCVRPMFSTYGAEGGEIATLWTEPSTAPRPAHNIVLSRTTGTVGSWTFIKIK